MKNGKNRLFLLIVCIVLSVQTTFASQLLIPGGQVVGLHLCDGTVTVAAFDDALGQSARQGGLQIGDQITAVDGTQIFTVMQLQAALARTDGQVHLTVLRDGEAKNITLCPAITSDGPKLGILLREGISGVGTVTWYDPASGSFGALGHSISNAQGNTAMLKNGTVYNASVISVKQGKIGTPGQLLSTLSDEDPVGTLEKNTPQGVFGTAVLDKTQQPLPVGSKADIHTGNAIIRSTIDGNGIREYSVEILKVYPHSGASGRNMLLKITDPALLNTTGGIVQGMSGSPVIQDGKLIGAVTHVLVNQPDTGYGIFIENMLDAAA